MGGPDRHFWRWLAVAFIVALTAFRIAYVGWFSPLDLAQDEAHYWDWARHLDWSYYSKGPLVAWLIHASCWLFGSLSTSLTGSEVLAVRFPAMVSGALFLAAIYLLTIQVLKNDRLAFLTMLVTSVLPAVTAGGMLITIDAPFVCLWAWSTVLGHAAVFGGRPWAWPLLGLTIGLGILAKYTMLLWPASAVLFCLFTPAYRPILRQRGLWIAAAVMAGCCLPILIWNLQHDWVSLRHVAGQAGVTHDRDKGSFRWFGPFEFLAGQLGVGLGIWFVLWALALVDHRPGRESDPEKRYLWWLAVPTFVLFAVVSTRTVIQINWPIAAYSSGMILTAGWLRDKLASPWPLLRRRLAFTASFGIVLALAGSVLALDARVLSPLAERWIPASDKNPAPARRLDPTTRLRGWKWLAGEVDKIRAEVARTEGREPLLACDRWNVAGELAFYGHDRPTVSVFGRAVGDRYSQYDLWRPNPLDDAQAFLGQTFVIVGEPKPEYPAAFGHLEPFRTLEYRENGQLIAWWYVMVARDFRGFPGLGKTGKY